MNFLIMSSSVYIPKDISLIMYTVPILPPEQPQQESSLNIYSNAPVSPLSIPPAPAVGYENAPVVVQSGANADVSQTSNYWVDCSANAGCKSVKHYTVYKGSHLDSTQPVLTCERRRECAVLTDRGLYDFYDNGTKVGSIDPIPGSNWATNKTFLLNGQAGVLGRLVLPKCCEPNVSFIPHFLARPIYRGAKAFNPFLFVLIIQAILLTILAITYKRNRSNSSNVFLIIVISVAYSFVSFAYLYYGCFYCFYNCYPRGCDRILYFVASLEDGTIMAEVHLNPAGCCKCYHDFEIIPNRPITKVQLMGLVAMVFMNYLKKDYTFLCCSN